jgi:hypothetical protein
MSALGKLHNRGGECDDRLLRAGSHRLGKFDTKGG